MILDSAAKVIRAYLGGAVTTLQPEWNVSWADHNLTTHQFTPAHNFGVLADTTPVVLIGSPSSGFQRQAKLISIYNADSAAIDLTVDVYDGVSARHWIIATALGSHWSLAWEPGGTWHVYDTKGILQIPVGSGGGGGSITVEAASGSPSFPSTSDLQFDTADGFVVSQPVAGTAKIKLTAAGSTSARRWAFMFGR